jgi:hypothetical protein
MSSRKTLRAALTDEIPQTELSRTSALERLDPDLSAVTIVVAVAMHVAQPPPEGRRLIAVLLGAVIAVPVGERA